MNKQTETALKMAKQHIIERKGGRGGAVCYVKSDEEVIKAIDEALAQPAQEPVVLNETILTAPKKIYLMVGDEYENNEPFPDNSIDVCWSTGKDFDNDVPYIRADLTHPAPSWQGLNEEEFIYFTHWVDADTLAEIEQTLKEKNHG